MSLRETHAIFVGAVLLLCSVMTVALFARFDAAVPWRPQLAPVLMLMGMGAAALIAGIVFWDKTRTKS